ncbi:MAG: adenosylcobinamide-GDP ribazoletransferase [Syntrophomonadaceae bacterium]|nr:adenosylcobinamide-GDP ribazoletransferase [Syntrophomonadaceae bacterium]
MRSFLLAFSFLTIIPAYGNRVAGAREMANSLYSYPLVGFIIGGFLALLAWLSNFLSLGEGGDALIIVSWIIITGGLHLDGVMDSADGLFSGRDRERKLEIMKDSRNGAMGGIALVSVLLLKFAFLASLPYSYKMWALFIAPAAGRCFMVYEVLLFPYARSEPSLGKCFGDNVGKAKILGATLVLVTGAFLMAKLPGLIFVVVTAFLVAMVALWINRSLGGHTGDTYGATCEVSETIFLMITVIGMAIYSHL